MKTSLLFPADDLFFLKFLKHKLPGVHMEMVIHCEELLEFRRFQSLYFQFSQLICIVLDTYQE